MDDKQGCLQELLIDLAKEGYALDDAKLDKYMQRFIDIYQDGFRHLYSGIFGTITRIDIEDNLSLDMLQQNMAFIRENSLRWNDSHKENVSEALIKSLTKLYDHINLDISRINYTKTIADRMEENNRETSRNLRIISKKANSMQKEHVTILGIFSSIVITFVAGMVFSSSVLNNIDKVSIYRLVFVMVLIALMIFNLVYLLLDFIAKLNNQRIITDSKDKKSSIIASVNAALFCMLLLDLVLWLFYWYRFS